MSFNPLGGGKVASAADVALNNPANGDTLQYDAVLQKWHNGVPSSSYAAHMASSRPIYPSPTANPYTIVFQDTFSLPNGVSTTSIDTTKWGYEQGTGAAYGNAGWGNSELETYTASTTNTQITSNGLEIRLINQPFTGYDGAATWTSGKITTKSNFAFVYGKAEAVIKVPYGKGAWPAFWLLGDNNSQAGWPGCGEIDIMESGFGGNFNKTLGTVHGPGYSGGFSVSHNYTNTDLLSNAFHKYGVEWTPGRIDWLINDTVYGTVLRSDVPQPQDWVFDAPHYLILNVAVANGGFPGTLDTSTFQTGTFGGQAYSYATMYVQSVTVSQRL